MTHYIFCLLYLFFLPFSCVCLCLCEHVSVYLHGKCVNFQIRGLLVSNMQHTLAWVFINARQPALNRTVKPLVRSQNAATTRKQSKAMLYSVVHSINNKQMMLCVQLNLNIVSKEIAASCLNFLLLSHSSDSCTPSTVSACTISSFTS